MQALLGVLHVHTCMPDKIMDSIARGARLRIVLKQGL